MAGEDGQAQEGRGRPQKDPGRHASSRSSLRSSRWPQVGWLGRWLRPFRGVTLDKGQIVAFMVAVATAALTAGWKWLQGWQQHQQNVADAKSLPLRKGPPRKHKCAAK